MTQRCIPLSLGLTLLSVMSTMASAASGPTDGRQYDEQVVAESGDVRVNVLDITAFLAGLPAEKIKSLKEAPSAEAIATDIAVRRILAERARKIQLDRDPIIAARVKLAAEKALSDLYLEQAERAASKDDVAERLAREEFKAFPERYRGDAVRVRHLLVAPHPSCERDPRAMAEGLLARIKTGEPFETIAAKYSDDPGSAKKGGDLGWIERGKTVPSFEAVAFGLKESGELSDLVETQFGLHVIQLIERKTGKRAFDDVRELLVESVRSNQKSQARREILEPLLAPDRFKIDRDALESTVGAHAKF